ncbi:HNH endonuclease [Anoxybacillus sp. CHMUD]|nr:HNH endonuclease [Anoxybacillus sp. CHMUD]
MCNMIYKKPKFLIWNKKFDIPKEKQTEMIIDAIAVIISKDILCPLRKRAANLLLKALLPGYTEIIEDCAVVVNRNDPLVIKWAKEVKKRDGYKCVKCGSTKKLHAHHISQWSDDPVNRINIDNGVTLCSECHAKEHEDIAHLILS